MPAARVARACAVYAPAQGTSAPVRAGAVRRPALDVDDLGEPPVAVDQEERPPAVAEPVDALEARQLDPVGEGVGGRRREGPIGVVAGPRRRAPVETRRFS